MRTQFARWVDKAELPLSLLGIVCALACAFWCP
jgi:hypothetical protein